MVRDLAGGFGDSVGNLDFNIKDQIQLFSAGYDQWGNYVREVEANWQATGTLDSPSPALGTITTFTARTPYTSGNIVADSLGIVAGTTGTFTVGTVTKILIRDAACGKGNIVAERTLTADDSIALYASAYDDGDNYLGAANVTWSSDGGLTPAASGTDTMFVFWPSLARVSGQIYAVFNPQISTSTGLITINPGAPFGKIVLHPDPRLIPANPDSFSIITSDVISDSDGNLISGGENFIVSASLGTITTPDEKPASEGHWIKSNADSKISFQINAGIEGGPSLIRAHSAGKGSAVGDTVLMISSLRILSVSAERQRATRGQTSIPFRMVVKNVGTETIDIQEAGLDFKTSVDEDCTDKFNTTRTDTITRIFSQGQATLTFGVDVLNDAPRDFITIDGNVSGLLAEKIIRETSAINQHTLLVQSPPVLVLESIETFVDTVIQGTNATVQATIRNDGDATAMISNPRLQFWAVNLGLDVTADYGLFPFLTNPDSIRGHSSALYSYTVKVGANATLDTVALRKTLEGSDLNTGDPVSLQSPTDYFDGWWVRQASDVEILEFSASQHTVTRNQDEDWLLSLIVKNSGGVDLKLDGVSVKFLLGGQNISSEYAVIYPSIFENSGDDTIRAGFSDTLITTIDVTGTTLGTVTVEGTVYLNDMISGQIIKSSATGVTVQSEAQLTIDLIRLSQPEVTVGQRSLWQIVVGITNNGGGDIAVDSTSISNFITFEGDDSFRFSSPDGLFLSGNFILKSGRSDSLIFTVDTTGVVAGSRSIVITISATEMNSLRQLNDVGHATIKVENP
ncbi:MAG: hypothetical protein SCK70_09680, partial [bacterium]|nr:hypothetical protein [bacterium]